MNIRLGNLSATDMEKRLGIEFPEDIKEFMNQTQQQKAADVQVGKWHCFDMPFELVCGDMETATKIFNSVKDKSDQCKEPLRRSINQK